MFGISFYKLQNNTGGVRLASRDSEHLERCIEARNLGTSCGELRRQHAVATTHLQYPQLPRPPDLVEQQFLLEPVSDPTQRAPTPVGIRFAQRFHGDVQVGLILGQDARSRVGQWVTRHSASTT